MYIFQAMACREQRRRKKKVKHRGVVERGKVYIIHIDDDGEYTDGGLGGY